MPQTPAQKFRIKEGFTLLTINAPKNFAQKLESLPTDVTISPSAKNFQQIHWFVKDRTQMEAELEKILAMVQGDVVCWIYYPKGTSGMQTDLTRDKGWETLLKCDMQWISLISFDETWSSFGMRQKTEKDQVKKPAVSRADAYADYIDTVAKTIKVPEDLSDELSKHKTLKEYFDKLAYSHRREYVEWILSAKREETRKARISGTIERLEKGWKNPAGR